MKVQVIWPPIVTFWPKGKKNCGIIKKNVVLFMIFLCFWGDFEQVLYLAFFDVKLRFLLLALKDPNFLFLMISDKIKSGYIFFFRLFMISRLLSINLRCDRLRNHIFVKNFFTESLV